VEQMKEILLRIQDGETSFKPTDDSPEALRDFQPLAKRIVSANERGFLVCAHFLISNMRSSYGQVREIITHGGLTFEGEQFLLSEPERQGNPESQSIPEEPREDLIDLRPNIAGIGLNLNEGMRRIKRIFRR
jgi:hypothetical protein